MSRETRSCQNCNNNFTIEPEDFKFYEKIKVPPPTWCPECRMVRRTAWRNEATVYRRKCELCGRDTISVYSSDKPFKIYCRDCWWSDRWEPINFKQNYDFSKPFFNQFRSLMEAVPHSALQFENVVNSEYLNHAANIKNGYLVFASHDLDNVSYSRNATFVKDSLDIDSTDRSEFCYEIFQCVKDFKVSFSGYAEECRDSGFLFDCRNCNNCVASVALRNKSYYIFNKPYTKEEYFEEIKKYNLGSYKTYQEVKKLAEEHWKKFPPKPKQDDMSVNCSGSHVLQSKNCKESLEVVGAEDSKYLWLMSASPIKDCYDVSSWGNNIALSYDCYNVGENVSGLKFCQENGINLYNAEYCKLSTGGSNHFGCVSVKKGDYVIFNKRYPKEEFEKLREKIIKHMNEMPYVDKKGRVYKYGEFFPIELSPFAYNETIANNFFPMQKEEILENGYKWREPEPRRHDTTMKAEDLPDHIKDAPDSILNEAIKCSTCERGYRIIPMELKFLRERNFPLPRECPFCRIEEKFNQWVKNLRLIDRVCDKCGAGFQTEFTKEETPVVYCKKCWQLEFI